MNWSHVGVTAGTGLLCFAVAAVLWYPFARKWPRVVVLLVVTGLVEVFGTGLGSIVAGGINWSARWVSQAIAWVTGLFSRTASSWFHTHGAAALTISAAALVAATAIVAGGWLIAHVAKNQVQERTFWAAFVLVALASIIPGTAGQWVSAALSGLAGVASVPLGALFGV
jgi:hypothetical protein